MALDPEITDLLKARIVSGGTNASELNGVVDRNAVQALTVIGANLLHQHGGVADDAGLIAALQTASGAPKQGSNVGGA